MSAVLRQITAAWLLFAAAMAWASALRWAWLQSRTERARERYRIWIARAEGRRGATETETEGG